MKTAIKALLKRNAQWAIFRRKRVIPVVQIERTRLGKIISIERKMAFDRKTIIGMVPIEVSAYFRRSVLGE